MLSDSRSEASRTNPAGEGAVSALIIAAGRRERAGRPPTPERLAQLPPAEPPLEREHAVYVLLGIGVQPVALDRGQPLVVAGGGERRVAAGRLQQ